MLTGPVADVIERTQQSIDELPVELEGRRAFMAAYLRTTETVGAAIEEARFEDPQWVERWDIAFANLFLDAHDADIEGRQVPRPWRLAFDAPADLPALRRVLLGINAHINYDLPQAMLAVISPDDFADPVLIERRRRDHERIDAVLASRVSAEDDALGDDRTLTDRLLTPFNRLGTKRFLRESRQKVWHNVGELNIARLRGSRAYEARLAELEVLSAARIADLLAPGQVILRLTIAGFGVTLPPL